MGSNEERELYNYVRTMTFNARVSSKGAEALYKFFEICSALGPDVLSQYGSAAIIYSVVLRSLSIEQSMKVIYALENSRKLANEHHLDTVFDALGQQRSDELVERINGMPGFSITGKAVREVLRVHRNIHVEFRYLDTENVRFPAQDCAVLIALNECALAVADGLYNEEVDTGRWKEIQSSRDDGPLTPEQAEAIQQKLLGGVPWDL